MYAITPDDQEAEAVQTPPLRWRFVASFAPLAMPAEYDPWLVARIERRTVWRQLLVLGETFVVLSVLAFVACRRARTVPAVLLAFEGLLVVLIVLVAAIAPSARRRMLERLDRPVGDPRPPLPKRSRWISIGAPCIAFGNLALQLALPQSVLHRGVLAVVRGSGCRGPDERVERALREAFPPGVSLTRIATVRAGETQAVALHLTAPDGTGGIPFAQEGDVTLLVDPPAELGGFTRGTSPTIVAVGSAAPVFARTHGIGSVGRSWSGFFLDPIGPAQACSTSGRATGHLHL